MTQQGSVVIINEDFPDDLQFLTDRVGPGENPVKNKSIYLSRAQVFDNGKTARIVAERVRNWYENNMASHDVEVDTREIELQLK